MLNARSNPFPVLWGLVFLLLALLTTGCTRRAPQPAAPPLPGLVVVSDPGVTGAVDLNAFYQEQFDGLGSRCANLFFYGMADTRLGEARFQGKVEPVAVKAVGGEIRGALHEAMTKTAQRKARQGEQAVLARLLADQQGHAVSASPISETLRLMVRVIRERVEAGEEVDCLFLTDGLEVVPGVFSFETLKKITPEAMRGFAQHLARQGGPIVLPKGMRLTFLVPLTVRAGARILGAGEVDLLQAGWKAAIQGEVRFKTAPVPNSLPSTPATPLR